ncbi:MAG: DUF2132 domain-containing protein [Sinobacterium sp.]|nr:DUF2132 domain-containing protein [Sinobacterium sp.]
MSEEQPNNPLHSITLKMMLTELVDHYGFDELGSIIRINCFQNDPSINSSLKFLRRTDWARTKVEDLYVSTFVD